MRASAWAWAGGLMAVAGCGVATSAAQPGHALATTPPVVEMTPEVSSAAPAGSAPASASAAPDASATANASGATARPTDGVLPPRAFEARCGIARPKDSKRRASGSVRVAARADGRVELEAKLVVRGQAVAFRGLFVGSVLGRGDYLGVELASEAPIAVPALGAEPVTHVVLGYSGDTSGGQDARGVHVLVRGTEDWDVAGAVTRTGACDRYEEVEALAAWIEARRER